MTTANVLVLMAAIYVAPNLDPVVRRALAWICLVSSVVSLIAGIK